MHSISTTGGGGGAWYSMFGAEECRDLDAAAVVLVLRIKHEIAGKQYLLCRWACQVIRRIGVPHGHTTVEKQLLPLVVRFCAVIPS